MFAAYGFTLYEYICGSFLVTVTTVSVLCSLTSMYLIHKLNKWNGYLILIYSMTACQLLTDLTFFLFIGYHNSVVYKLICFLLVFGGLSVTFWTNVLSGIVLYIVTAQQSFQIRKEYWKFFVICMFPALIYASIDTIMGNPRYLSIAYSLAKLISIIFNFAVYIFISVKLHRLGNSESKSTGPLRELAARFKYYPIAQVVTRIPALVYQSCYGFEFESFSEFRNTTQIVLLFIHASFAPSAGIAYFFVFLYMQPQAAIEFRLLRIRLFNCICGCGSPDPELLSDYTNSSGSRSLLSSSHISNFLESPASLNANKYAPVPSDGTSHVALNLFPEEKRKRIGTPVIDGHAGHDEDLDDDSDPMSWRRYRSMDEEELNASIIAMHLHRCDPHS